MVIRGVIFLLGVLVMGLALLLAPAIGAHGWPEGLT
jgi:hypothetical protein